MKLYCKNMNKNKWNNSVYINKSNLWKNNILMKRIAKLSMNTYYAILQILDILILLNIQITLARSV